MSDRYKIIRYYYRGSVRRTIRRDLSLEEAQAHCRDPETSSKTAQSAKARALTDRRGQWFDGYEHDR